MNSKRAVVWVVAGLLAIAALGILLITALQAGVADEALVRAIAAGTHRSIEVRGDLRLNLWSMRPRIEASDVTIGNPPWMPAGRSARLERMIVTFAPSLRHPLRLHGIALQGGELALSRLASGAANWSASAPGRSPRSSDSSLSALRALSLERVRLRLQDEPRHLDFDAALNTRVRADGRLEMDARGSLNGRPVQVHVVSDALASQNPDEPWHFDFDERSSNSRLDARVTLPRPFDFDRLTAHFTATGDDLRDLYFLTGVRLPDTGSYRFTGRYERDGLRFEFRELQLRSGESDISGSIVTDASRQPRHIDADLHSKRARLRDVGKRAAGRGAPASGPPRLFANWEIPVAGVRLGDARIRYRADAMEVARVRVAAVDMTMKIEGDVLTAEPVTARTVHGKATARVVFDVRTAVPKASARIDASGLELGELLPGKGPTPSANAPLDASLQLEGAGASFHALFGSSNGTVNLRVPGGELRAALAQLLGLDLRALGLALAHEGDRVALRCAALDARVTSGKAQLERLVIDIAPVALVGDGAIDFETEALDVTLRARNKAPGLRLRGPLRIAGTLREPALRLGTDGMVKQGIAAAALATFIAPVAAAVALVDPGNGKDADCTTLLAR